MTAHKINSKPDRLTLEQHDTQSCKGLFFRAHMTKFMSSMHTLEFVEKRRLRILKKRSCKGCVRCEGLREMLKESIFNEFAPDVTHVKEGALYKLQCNATSTDPETGLVDDWELEFVEIKED